MTSEDLGPIKETEITCAVVTRTEAVRQERKIRPLEISDVCNVKVTTDSFKIAQGEDPLKVFFDKTKQTSSSDPMKNPYFMNGGIFYRRFQREKTKEEFPEISESKLRY